MTHNYHNQSLPAKSWKNYLNENTSDMRTNNMKYEDEWDGSCKLHQWLN